MGLPSRLGCVCMFQCVCTPSIHILKKKKKKKRITVCEEEKITMKIGLSQ